MTPLLKIDLSNADRAFATANTPLYLIRKLLSDRAIRLVAREIPPQDILKELKSALKHQAVDFRSSVYPYVLLVALSLNSDNRFLTKASAFKAPYHRWYAYCADYLLESFQTTSVTALHQDTNLVLHEGQSRNSSNDALSRVNKLVIGGN